MSACLDRTRDAAGYLTNDGTTGFAYDALGRLTGTSATGQTRNYAYSLSIMEVREAGPADSYAYWQRAFPSTCR